MSVIDQMTDLLRGWADVSDLAAEIRQFMALHPHGVVPHDFDGAIEWCTENLGVPNTPSEIDDAARWGYMDGMRKMLVFTHKEDAAIVALAFGIRADK